jgi:hypothetical protein
VAAGDVDGDSLPDLVLIAHDRVLIYRQDSGLKADINQDKNKEPQAKIDRSPSLDPTVGTAQVKP